MSVNSNQAMRRGSAWARLHAALMPDYNRPATAYWWTMLLLGLAAFGWAVHEMFVAQDAAVWLQLAGGIALVMLTALFPLKIPRTNQSFSVGDVFVYLVLLGLGPAAGTIIAALDGLVMSWRSSRRWTTRLGTAAIACITMTACGNGLHALLAVTQGGAAALVLVTMAFGACYAACNALLMTTVARLKRGERISLTALLDVFGWVGGASAGAAAMAALLFIVQRLAGLWAMLAILPVFGLLLTTMHFFSRQQEAEEAARRATAEALEHKAELASSQARQREAELAAQHLRELKNSERRFHSAFTHASIGMALVGADGRIQLANPALQALLGADTALAGQRFGDFVSAIDLQRFELALERIVGGRAETAPIEVCCRRGDGCELWASIACSMFSDSGADKPSLILQIQDVTARRRAEAELQHRAFHDKLTGLPNRDHFHQALEAAIIEMQVTGDRGRAFAVMFLGVCRAFPPTPRGRRLGQLVQFKQTPTA